MQLINNNMKWIMLISGALTFTMVFAAIFPQLALNSMFGSSLEGPRLLFPVVFIRTTFIG